MTIDNGKRYIIKNQTTEEFLHYYKYINYGMAVHTAEVLTRKSKKDGINHIFTVQEVPV